MNSHQVRKGRVTVCVSHGRPCLGLGGFLMVSALAHFI